MARITKHLAHAQLRAYQRYGDLLSRGDVLAIGRLIDADCGELVKSRGSRGLYQVAYRGRDYLAVYSHAERVVVTFLTPPGRIRMYRARLTG